MISHRRIDTPEGAPRIARELPQPRICLPTSRNVGRRAFQCGLYEAQDVVGEIDAVDLIEFEPRWSSSRVQRLQRRVMYWDPTRSVSKLNPGLQRLRLTRDYELLAIICHNYWDLLYLNALDGWKERCRIKVCWLSEMYASLLPRYKRGWLHLLKQFDHVFVASQGIVGPLSGAIERECRWLPGGVDAVRFSPYPTPPSRVIDVYSIGRRLKGVHESLLAAARRRELFYVFDTFPGADVEPYDHRQHRDLLATMAKRSRYFTVAPGKIDAPEETHGQLEIGHRYFEGAAAGTVMIGQPVESPVFRSTFPWPDVVIPVRPDGSDVVDVLADLAANPGRLAAIGRRNAAEALLRHDWLYRWKEILRVAGLDVSSGMASREAYLQELAVIAARGENRLPGARFG